MNFGRLTSARPAVAERLSADLASFCKAAWPVIHPGAKLVWNWHLDLLCEHLELVRRRQTTRLICNIPPRTSKSSIASICFPVWCWLQDPRLAFLCCSYELDLAGSHNLERRRLITSAWFQGLFAERFKLSTDRSLVDEFTNASGGRMLAASTNSRAMGRGGDIVIVDDPLSADVAYSDILRNEVNQWFVHMLPQRLNDPATSPIVLIQQRLHEADSTGFLLESDPGEWTHLRLPLEAEEPERWVFPVSGRVVERKTGDILDAKRFPRKVVEARKRNRLVWAGQFQQRPAPIEGNLIQTADIRYFGGKDPVTGERDAQLPERFDQTIISVDASFKDTKSSDYVAVLVVGVRGARRFLRNVVNARMDLDATETTILQQHSLYGPISAVLIEDAANGPAIVSHLKDKISGVIAVPASGGKIARMVASSPSWQAHNWSLDRCAGWTGAFVTQVTMFPNARHDDMVDAMTQAEVWLQSNSFSLGLIDYYKTKIAGIASGVLRLAPPSRSGVPAVFEPVAVAGPASPKKDALACPDCRSTLIQNVSNTLRCQQCGLQFTRDGKRLLQYSESGTCCSSPLPVFVAGGQTRCNNCGVQRWPGSKPPSNGVSKKDLRGLSRLPVAIRRF